MIRCTLDQHGSSQVIVPDIVYHLSIKTEYVYKQVLLFWLIDTGSAIYLLMLLTY